VDFQMTVNPSPSGEIGQQRRAPFPVAGAAAGALSTLAFAGIHAVFISDIWSSAPVMMVAGAVCGLCIAWSYRLVAPSHSVSRWVRYNAAYVGLFLVLGVLSVVVFEPVTTIPALITAGGPPDHLFRLAAPLTVAFTVVAAGLVTVMFGRGWKDYGPILATMTVLVLLLGLNVSAMGLVEVPTSSLYLVGELFGLIIALDVVFAVLFLLIVGRSPQLRTVP
jgi:hypothetical protein